MIKKVARIPVHINNGAAPQNLVQITRLYKTDYYFFYFNRRQRTVSSAKALPAYTMQAMSVVWLVQTLQRVNLSSVIIVRL